MSLINQMLEDLDRRRAAAEPALGDIQPAMGKVRRASVWIIAPLALGGLSVLVWMTFLTGDTQPAPVVAVETVPAIPDPAHVAPAVLITDAALHTVPTPDVVDRYSPPPAAPVSTPDSTIESTPPAVVSKTTVPETADARLVDEKPEMFPVEDENSDLALGEPVLFASLEPPPVIKTPTTLSPTERAVRAVERARTHVRAGRLREAEQTLRDACVTWPGQSESWTLLATLLTSQGRGVEAGAVLRESLENVDRPGPPAKMLARHLLHEGQADAALAVLKEHRGAAVNDSEYEALLAALLQRDGSHGEALELYRLLVTRDEPRVEWWLGLAVTSDQLGDHTAALAAYRRVESMPGLSGQVREYVAGRVGVLAKPETGGEKP